MSKIKEINERRIPGGSIPLGMSIVQHEHLMLQATREDVADLLKVLEDVRAALTNPEHGWVLIGHTITDVLEAFDAEWLNGQEDPDA